MGYFKQRQIEKEELRRIAEETAIRAGLLARCPDCRTTCDPLMGAYVQTSRLANHLITYRDDNGL